MITEVSELASFLAMPREGHLEAAFHIFNFLDKKHNARIVFDPSYPAIDMSVFKECDWKQYIMATSAMRPFPPTHRNPEAKMLIFASSSTLTTQVISKHDARAQCSSFI
jgi:hypothetical protein